MSEESVPTANLSRQLFPVFDHPHSDVFLPPLISVQIINLYMLCVFVWCMSLCAQRSRKL